MSSLTHASTMVTARLRAHWTLALGALVALIAAAAVLLALAAGDGPPAGSVTSKSHGAAHFDRGPDESRTAAAIGAGRELGTKSARPDESAVASAISSR